MSIIPLAMGLWLMNFMRLGENDDNDYNDIQWCLKLFVSNNKTYDQGEFCEFCDNVIFWKRMWLQRRVTEDKRGLCLSSLFIDELNWNCSFISTGSKYSFTWGRWSDMGWRWWCLVVPGSAGPSLPPWTGNIKTFHLNSSQSTLCMVYILFFSLYLHAVSEEEVMVADEILPGELHHDGEEGWDGAQSKQFEGFNSIQITNNN